MKIVLVSKCFLDIEQYIKFKMSVLISPSKSLISWRWVTYYYYYHYYSMGKAYLTEAIRHTTYIPNRIPNHFPPFFSPKL